jgi:hypothetical protein
VTFVLWTKNIIGQKSMEKYISHIFINFKVIILMKACLNNPNELKILNIF